MTTARSVAKDAQDAAMAWEYDPSAAAWAFNDETAKNFWATHYWDDQGDGPCAVFPPIGMIYAYADDIVS